MPKVILRTIWIAGAVLTIGGLIFAVFMARGEERSLLHLLPAFAGAILLMCMVFVGLINDVVSDLLRSLRQFDKKKSDAESGGVSEAQDAPLASNTSPQSTEPAKADKPPA